MPRFIFMMVVILAAVWVLASGLYKPLGKFFGKIFTDAKDAMAEDDNTYNEDRKDDVNK